MIRGKHICCAIVGLFLSTVGLTAFTHASEKSSDSSVRIQWNLLQDETGTLTKVTIEYLFMDGCKLRFQGGIKGAFESYTLACTNDLYRGPIERDIDASGGPEKLFDKMKVFLKIDGQ